MSDDKNSKVTEYGKQVIEKQLACAIRIRDTHLTEVAELTRKIEFLANAKNCEHKKLKCKGGLQLIEIECNDCGFVWFE